MRTLLLVLAHCISVLATVVLLAAVPAYSYSGEPFLPYLVMVPLWLAVYWGVSTATHRREARRTPRPRGLGRPALLAGLAIAGLVIAVLSLGLAMRYTMTPASIRRLEAAATHHLTPVEGAREARCLSYYTAGAGPGLIFIHGTPGHAGVFAHYLVEPLEGFESVAVDRPGYVGSERSGPVTSFEEQARIIATLLEERNGRWPILVGHSLGGPIAARIAADYPDRVGGLVILAGSLDPSLEGPEWYNMASTLPVIEQKMPGIYQSSNDEIEAAAEQTRLLAEVLHQVRCPVRVVHGTADTLVPVANVEFIKRAFTGSPSIEVELVPGEGHAVHTKQEKLVRRVINELVATLNAMPRTP